MSYRNTAPFFMAILFTLSLSAKGARRCSNIFNDLNAQAVKMSFEADFSQHYQCFYCLANVQLFMARTLSEYPLINPNDFEVLIITTPDYRKAVAGSLLQKIVARLRSEDRYFRLSLSNRRSLPPHVVIAQEENSTAAWSFHAVLKYKGMIFDFDNGDRPTIMTNEDYFQTMVQIKEKKTEFFLPVMDSGADPVLVIPISGSRVMNAIPGETDSTRLERYFLETEAISVSEYLQRP